MCLLMCRGRVGLSSGTGECYIGCVPYWHASGFCMLEECMPLDGALGSVGLWICRECVICVFGGKDVGC